MNARRESIGFENPQSTRSKRARAAVRRKADDLIDRYVASKTPDARKNAEDLAGELNEGTQIIVIGGDGTLKAAAEAIRLSGLQNISIVAVEGGDSCDGSKTLNRGISPFKGDRLSQLLTRGVPVPANTIGYKIKNEHGELEDEGDVINYLGVGLTAKSAKIADSEFVRRARSSIPGHEKHHKLARVVDYAAVGFVVLGGLPFHPFEIERDGGRNIVNEVTYAIGDSIAGSFRLSNGDVFNQENPQIARYEIPSKDFLRNLPTFAVAMKRGTYQPDSIATDEITVMRSIGVQMDGEHKILSANSQLSVEVNRAAYSTLVLPEEI